MDRCFAVIIDGVVDNIIVADDDKYQVEGAEMVEYKCGVDFVSPGFLYKDGKFTVPKGYYPGEED